MFGVRYEDHRESLARDARCAWRIASLRAEDHLHAELGRRRRSCAVFLCPEDGPLQTSRPRRRLRDRARLGSLGAEGGRRPIPPRPLPPSAPPPPPPPRPPH